MLRALEIRDMLIIERLDLAFQPGLNVLTGETGAGKSILLDSLGFVLGWRGRADLVRQGAARGEVTAVFDLPPGHPAHRLLEEAGIEPGEDPSELILRRVNTADGRKTAWINDRRASGEMLRALSGTLVELHGQQDDRGLLDPRVHRALLDDFAGAGPLLEEIRAAWARRREARAALDRAESEREALRREEDFLRHAVAELAALDPQDGEEEALDSARRLMQAGSRIAEGIGRALQAVSAQGAEGMISDAVRWLSQAAGQAEGRLDAPLEALDRAREALAEAEAGIADCLEAIRHDPRALEETEERLFAIRGLARKHGVRPDDLPALRRDLEARLAALDDSEAGDRRLRAALRAAEAAYDDLAGRLSALRREAGTRLARAMAAELPPLKMERAVFSVEVTGGEPGPDGQDEVRFLAATNPGAPPGPIDRIASGGELSRFLLALKVCLMRGEDSRTLIFDEIDRGVGGATAAAVGRRLAALARGGQVLVVTHSPQVAAMGNHHWRVEKTIAGDRTTSRVVPLDRAGRVDEIARMLAGDHVTDAARGAALALLQGMDAA
ncbi:DNA replication and repair protein RecN [Rubellimicrobium thermophilum DSM 16684]|uniref:DNA repair protein RecN n=1 Tax=Rubellimicrobium thermophilum DSM 16684 TaxID=1123069 RepID=S9R5B9_9RHOB|nr:DNA repair protein RecN [Rubellimicrobium thermophilum]EPX87163.1 DNA replication and repair protein RecN [Rubellimicrobium thermophilum DSM 16684]